MTPVDPDNDGMVNNFEECVYGSRNQQRRHRRDGLTDGQESTELGIDPTLPDTDGQILFDYQTP